MTESCQGLESQVCFKLYAASRKAIGYYTALLKPYGLTYTQYLVLRCLSEKDSVSVKELGEKLNLDSGTLTPLLKSVEKEGYLTRSRDGKDERIVRITLTREGLELSERISGIPEAACRSAGLLPQEAETLGILLDKLLKKEKV